MAFVFKFPITLDDAAGETRAPTAGEINLSIDCTGYAQTIYQRDKGKEGGTAIWFEDGAIYVAKMFPSWCPGIYDGCRPTEPPVPKTEDFYDVYLHWLADSSYMTHISFYLNDDGTITVV